MRKRPNIVIFNPDSYRGDVLHHMGNRAAVTPNLDAIVGQDAVSFRNAFCQNPVCTPSRCSFMSGWYPHVRGHRTMNHMMQRDEPVLLKALNDEGYFVWWGGKNDLVPGQNGLDEYCNIKYDTGDAKSVAESLENWRGDPQGNTYYSFHAGKLDKGDNEVYSDRDWANVKGAVEFVKTAPKNQPFCLYLPLSFPHPPYAVEEPWYSMIDRNEVEMPIPAPSSFEGLPKMMKGLYDGLNMTDWTQEQWRELKAVYYGMCSRIDHQFGLLVSALKEAGVYDDTAIFFFSDHGDFTGDFGLVEKAQNIFADCLTRVPFIIKPPSWIPVQSGIRNELTELVDFPATVEEMTGITPKHTHFGRSLVKQLMGQESEVRNAVFCEGGCLEGETHCGSDENAQTMSPAGLYWPRAQLQRNRNLELSKAVMCRTKQYKYIMRLYEGDELYDLENDPGETVNKIEDPQLKSVADELKNRLLRFYLETGDVVPFQRDQR